MLYSPTYWVGQILAACQPAWWGILYQLPIACLVAYIAIATQVEERPVGAQMWKVIAATAVAGTALFQLVLWIVPGIIGLVLGVVGMYVLIMAALDRLLLLHLDHAHNVTSYICIVTWLLWLIIGLAVVVVRTL